MTLTHRLNCANNLFRRLISQLFVRLFPLAVSSGHSFSRVSSVRHIRGFLLFVASGILWTATVGSLSAVAQETEKPESESEEFKNVEPPPIKRIVMFNSGLSQFIHSGNVDGNVRVEMKFTVHDVDDVLKSLVFEDQGGGMVRAVEYKPAPDSQDIAARKLGPPMTLAQTMQKYRGEEITVSHADGADIIGSIVGVENRQDGISFVETLTLVNDDGFISVSLTEVKQIRFSDEKLREEFKQAMVGLTKTRTTNLKTLGLLFEGEGERKVRFSYNVDAPIWRMTYRLEVGNGTSTLQGWAHIDNVTGVDWKGIELDLRSGRPQSFRVDLFAPVLAERVSLGLSLFDISADQTLVPQWFGFDQRARLGGFDVDRDEGGGRMVGGGGGGFGRGGGGFGGGGSREREESPPVDINSAIDAAARGDRAAKMVQFKLKDLVNLKAGRSAMVPVLKSQVPTELFSIVDVDARRETAKFYVRLTNETGLPIIPGPVTMYLNGDFVGDGAMARVEPGSVEGFVYGTDRSVTITDGKSESKELVDRVTREEGFVRLEMKVIATTRYEVTNSDSLPRQVLLEMSSRSKSVEPKPDRTNGGVLQYKLQCKANSTVNQIVVETDKTVEKLPLREVDEADLKKWQKDNATVDAKLLEFLAAVFKKKAELSAAQTTLAKIEGRVKSIRTEQTRITNIIKVLEAESVTMKQFLDKLSKTETEFDETRIQLEAAEATVASEEKNLEALFGEW